MENELYVSNFKAICFMLMKKTLICLIWILVPFYMITYGYVWSYPVGIASAIAIALLPSVRMIATAIGPATMLAGLFALRYYKPIFWVIYCVVFALYLIPWSQCMIVWRRLMNGKYVISPLSNRLMWNPSYWIANDRR